MLLLYIYLGSIIYFSHNESQHCAYVLVGFRHRSHLVSVRKTSRFCLKYPACFGRLKNSWKSPQRVKLPSPVGGLVACNDATTVPFYPLM